jgi:hypothetical protein
MATLEAIQPSGVQDLISCTQPAEANATTAAATDANKTVRDIAVALWGQARGVRLKHRILRKIGDMASQLDCAVTEPESGVLERVSVPYVPMYQRFLVRDKRFVQQYSHIYARRLDAMRPLLKDIVEAAWGPDGSLDMYAIK